MVFIVYVLVVCEGLECVGIIGVNGGEIDYIELFVDDFEYDSCSFVLCLGFVYDCLLCGIGMSVKFVCFVVDGKFVLGVVWW